MSSKLHNYPRDTVRTGSVTPPKRRWFNLKRRGGSNDFRQDVPNIGSPSPQRVSFYDFSRDVPNIGSPSPLKGSVYDFRRDVPNIGSPSPQKGRAKRKRNPSLSPRRKSLKTSPKKTRRPRKSSSPKARRRSSSKTKIPGPKGSTRQHIRRQHKK